MRSVYTMTSPRHPNKIGMWAGGRAVIDFATGPIPKDNGVRTGKGDESEPGHVPRPVSPKRRRLKWQQYLINQ